MKATILSILSIILLAILIFGNIHWKTRSESPLYTLHPTEDADTEVESKDQYFSIDYYMSFAKSWPENAQQVLKDKLTAKKPFHILLVGSEAIGDQNVGLISPLKEALSSTYDQYVTIESSVYDGTTSDYVSEAAYESLIDKQPDMVIFEPFLLHDNNIVDISTTLTNIHTVIRETKAELPNITFVLMPAHQIYDASLYPMQVSDLEKYAGAQDIPYWNHWEAWPDGKDEKVLDYIDSTNGESKANEKGYKVWSDYLIKKLVSK